MDLNVHSTYIKLMFVFFSNLGHSFLDVGPDVAVRLVLVGPGQYGYIIEMFAPTMV